MSMAQDTPAYPDQLSLTLNGEKELPGVTVRQGMTGGPESLHIDIKGTCDAENLTVTFATPEGWDGMMIMDQWGEGVISTIPTRSEGNWLSKEAMMNMDFHEGNSLTYSTLGESQTAEIALVKGDQVYTNTIGVYFEVSYASGSENPGEGDDPIVGEEPVFPTSVGVTTYAEGLEKWQGLEDGTLTIILTGEIKEPKFNIVLDVPEGWDGYISIPYADGINVTESGIIPKIAKMDEYSDWQPIDEFIEKSESSWGAITPLMGNNFSFNPDGEEQDVAIYLYKNGQVFLGDWISLESIVSVDWSAANQVAYEDVIAQLDALQKEYDAAVAEIKEVNPDFDFSMYEEIPVMLAQYKEGAAQALASATEDGVSFSYYFPFDGSIFEEYIEMMKMEGLPATDDPVVPESYDITSSCPDLTIERVEDEYGFVDYVVTGECPEDVFTITVAVPEGWTNFIGYTDLDYDYGIDPLKVKKVEPIYWTPVEDMLEDGLYLTNSLTFPADGKEHYGQLMLVKDDLADLMNPINISVLVSKSEGSAVGSINVINNATYYDLNGNKVNAPKAGMYIKVVDGKATKVIVK